MTDFKKIYQQVYKKNNLYSLKKDKPCKNILKNNRPNTVAVVGGALGDEGKGRVTDELTALFLKNHQKVVHYRDNGGANAGHTVETEGVRIALHQLGSGIMQKNADIIMGKEMVLHPEDLVTEIKDVLKACKSKKLPANLIIDEMAFLCLDTHRAFEAVIKMRSRGGEGATGRGISPAYADVVFRHPLRMRDLMARTWKKKLKKHYEMYRDWVKGMGYKLTDLEAPRLGQPNVRIGSYAVFEKRLAKTRQTLKQYVQPVQDKLNKYWEDGTPIVIEKSQALGLDKRWGVYPDVTASNCGFDGIFSSTEGVFDPDQFSAKIATIKATYSSSVGARRLPTLMKGELADRIRKDAHEYGATTGRPRDIAHIDLPMLSFLAKTGRVEYLAITHLDISYPDTPVKVCVGYEIEGKPAVYRPDQEHLDKVKPIYIELPAWDGAATQKAKKISELPQEAQQYVAFISESLGVTPLLITTGPKRHQTIKCF